MIVQLARASSGIAFSDWVSGLALLVALTSVYLATRSDKVDRLTKIHEALITEEAQEGRRELWEVWSGSGDFGDVKSNRRDTWDRINRAMSLLDVLGYYYEKGMIPKKSRWDGSDPVLDLWGETLNRMSEPALAFIDYRREDENNPRLWEFSVDLVEYARKAVAQQ